MTTNKNDNNPQPDESPKDQSQSAQPQDELNNFPWLKSLVPQQGAESPDELLVKNDQGAQSPAVDPISEGPSQPTVQQFPKHSREIPRTLLETDISKFSESLGPEQSQTPPQPSEPPAGGKPSSRPVARTLMETDISQFMDDLQPSSSEPTGPLPTFVPTIPPGNRNVARTLMETDISMFRDESLAGEKTPPEPTPPAETEERVVSRTLLEHELPQFSDALMNPAQPQAPQAEPPRPSMTEERTVSRTLLEHELPQFSDGLTAPEEPQMPPAEPSRPSMTQERNVARTLLETDISAFADVLQPQPEKPKTMINFEDNQSFSGIQSARPSMPFPDHSIPPDSGLAIPDPSQQLYAEDPNPGANMTGRNLLPDRTAPKTLLDKEMLLTHLQGPIERLEAAEKQRIESQPMKAFQPIENYKSTAPGCPWTWEDSRSKVAFCSKCNAQAYNFEGMQMPEALKLIYQRENIEKPRLFKREDGKFMTRDCPVAAKRRALPLMIIGGVLIVIALIALVFMFMPGSVPSMSLPSFQSEEAATPTSSSSNWDSSNSSSSGSTSSSRSSSDSSSSSSSSTSSDTSSGGSSDSSKGEFSVTSKRPPGGWRKIHKDTPGGSEQSGASASGESNSSSSSNSSTDRPSDTSSGSESQP